MAQAGARGGAPSGVGCLLGLLAAMMAIVTASIVGVVLAGLTWRALPVGLLLAVPLGYAWTLWRDCRPPQSARTLSGETLPELRARPAPGPAVAIAPRPRYASDAAWRRHAGQCPACWEALWLDGEPCSIGQDLRPLRRGAS
jgi:hypothetical protein